MATDGQDVPLANRMQMSVGATEKISRQEQRRLRQLEEDRKSGKAPLELDAEGKPINPHIPQFISKAPWYADDASGRALSHQRVQAEDDKDQFKEQWYVRGKRSGPAATKYRKGACENCGAMTHKAKDCVERPRKKGARWTGSDIQADEVISDYKPDWNAKRDHWSAYDPREYQKVIREYEQMEEARQDIMPTESNEKITDREDQRGQMSKNLRIREDKAKYLLDLDQNSAEYDPKSRSLKVDDRDNKGAVAAEGFSRESKDKEAFDELQRFAWQSSATGGANYHAQANPTAGEIAHRKHVEQERADAILKQKQLAEKYGIQDTRQLPPELLQSSDSFVEYTASGDIIKPKPNRIPTSRYSEDEYPNNHSSVYGSYWEDGKWGFACCHQFYKNSYCTNLSKT